MQNGTFQAKFYEFGSRGIWDTVYPIYVIKPLILRQNPHFYYINRIYRISNTPGTKFIKYGLKCSILHFKLDKTIKFERIFFHLSLFLNPYRKFVLKTIFIRLKWQFKIIWIFAESCPRYYLQTKYVRTKFTR